MKIGLVSEHASPLAALGGEDAGGQNVHVAALAAALGRNGHEVTVYTRRDDPDLPASVLVAPGVTVEHVAAGPPAQIPKDQLLQYMPAFAGWLARRWREDRPDIVHAHFWMSGLATLEAADLLDIPVVETFHALGSQKRRHQAAADTSPPERVRAEVSIVRRAAAIIATCTDEVRELNSYGARPGRVFVVPCGVDVALFRGALPADRKPPDPIAPECGKRLVSLGRLVPRKGVDTVIAALADVPGAHLVIAGGPAAAQLGSDPEVRRLRAAAAAAGVAERVTFTGRIQREDVPALLRSADAVVSVPWYEPFGIVPLEAMACGSAVVASAVGGHLDTVQDGRTGLLVPPRDPEALADRIRLLLAKPLLRAALGRAGLTQVRTQYSWDTIADRTEAVYEQVVGALQADPGVSAVRL